MTPTPVVPEFRRVQITSDKHFTGRNLFLPIDLDGSVGAPITETRADPLYLCVE